jgi:hypothetical protein
MNRLGGYFVRHQHLGDTQKLGPYFDAKRMTLRLVRFQRGSCRHGMSLPLSSSYCRACRDVDHVHAHKKEDNMTECKQNRHGIVKMAIKYK